MAADRASIPRYGDAGCAVHSDERAGWLSRLTFGWVFSLLATGYRKPLQKDDIWRPDHQDVINVNRQIISQEFNRRVSQNKPLPLTWAFHAALGARFWVQGIWMLFANLLQIAAPLILRYLLIGIERQTSGSNSSLFLQVVLLFVSQMGMSLAIVHYHYLGQVLGSQVRAVLTTILFDKALKISSNERINAWSDAKVTTLIGVDSERIESAVLYANMIWTEPLAIISALVILFINLGWTAIIGLILLIAGAQIQKLSMSWLFAKRRAINEKTDQRTTYIQEALANIRFLKSLSWEPYFLRRVSEARRLEVAAQQGLVLGRSSVISVSQSLPAYAAMISFVTFSLWTRGGLTAAQAFSSLALFNCLRMPLAVLPMVFNRLMDAWASIQRVEAFLKADEQEDQIVWDSQAPFALEMVDFEGAWDRVDPAMNEDEVACEESSAESSPSELVGLLARDESSDIAPSSVLSAINLQVRPGELVAVIGSVASGKSALLASIAGQLPRMRGSITIGASSRSFYSQTSWTMSGTVRENVLFGQPFRQEWYDRVLDACALRLDLDLWEAGDQTLIGEQGITLSGGQKQRICLARAIYADADMILLDDPLSAVDAHVGQHIFDQAICDALADKTRILVTNQWALLPRCDRVVWLERGRVKAFDTFDNLSRQNDFLQQAPHVVTKDADRDEPSEAIGKSPTLKPGSTEDSKGTDAPLIDEETRELGNVRLSTYQSYVAASGMWLIWPAVLSVLLISQASDIFGGVWLSWWVDPGNHLGLSQKMYIAGYVLLGVLQSASMCLYLTVASVVSVRASDHLFRKALQRVLSAPIAFHIANPVGRLMNLFTNDVNQLDNAVGSYMQAFFSLVGSLTSTMILVTVQFPGILLFVPFGVAVSYYAGRYYQASRRELRRLENLSRSTISAKAIESVSGRLTICSFRVEHLFQRELERSVTYARHVIALTSASQQWLNLRLDSVGNLLILIVGVLIVACRVQASVAGLLLTYAIALVQIIPAAVTQAAEVESSLVFVERMAFYGSTIPAENLRINHEATPEDVEALFNGEIDMSNVSFRYKRDRPLVLKDLSLKIAAGEKIGIIGRTGAGKSSLASLLLRLYPWDEGTIYIGGIDITKLDLTSLRRNLAIVPQHPVLFQGTVRLNLDPFQEKTDEVLWNALQQVRLWSTTPSGQRVHLDQEVQPDAANFSLGERQLLALARAVVHKKRILICDEATSAVDYQTDQIVQGVIMDAFRDSTVLCIAHRLQTVMSYDRICVLDQGKIIAFDKPIVLFDTDERFRQLCQGNRITRDDLLGERSR